MKQQIDMMTGEPLVWSDQVSAEASTRLQKAAAYAAACTALVLSLPGGIGVPAPRSESIIMEVESDGGEAPQVPRQRAPELFGYDTVKRR